MNRASGPRYTAAYSRRIRFVDPGRISGIGSSARRFVRLPTRFRAEYLDGETAVLSILERVLGYIGAWVWSFWLYP